MTESVLLPDEIWITANGFWSSGNPSSRVRLKRTKYTRADLCTRTPMPEQMQNHSAGSTQSIGNKVELGAKIDAEQMPAEVREAIDTLLATSLWTPERKALEILIREIESHYATPGVAEIKTK